MKQERKAPPSAAQAELEKLQNEQRQRQQEFFKRLDKLKENEQQRAYQDFNTRLFSDFWPRYQALIKKTKGGVQVRARMAAIELAQGAQKPAQADQLIADILRENRDQAETAQLAMTLRYDNYQPEKKATIKAKLDALGKSKDATVRAAALYALAEVTKDTNAKAAVPLYQKLLAQYPTSSYAKLATGAIFESEHLQVGMIAPEITGPDQEGKTFQLSEYRGKVVVLDFWGFW